MATNGKYFELLAAQSAAGKTIKDGAAAIGCSTSHGYTISSSLAFRQRVSEIRAAMTDRAVGELSAGAAEAVTVLRDLLKLPNEPSVRLQAATKLLALLGPLSEANELRQRLNNLEQNKLPELRLR